jgi:hypothetical protein
LIFYSGRATEEEDPAMERRTIDVDERLPLSDLPLSLQQFRDAK